jgi:hypothetical protein
MQMPACTKGDHVDAYINGVHDERFECAATTGATGQGNMMLLASNSTHIVDTISCVGATTTVANLSLAAAIGVPRDDAASVRNVPHADGPTGGMLLARIRLFARFWRRATAACRAAAWDMWYSATANAPLRKSVLVAAVIAAYNGVANVRSAVLIDVLLTTSSCICVESRVQGPPSPIQRA